MNDFLATHYNWLRAGHILFVIAWMAGLLYLPRLFVYHADASPGGELDETLKLQERRLLKLIMNPAMIFAWALGVLLVVSRGTAVLGEAWMMVKLAMVIAMTGLHHVYALECKAFERSERRRTSRFFRLINEAPAALALIIVIMAVVEPF